MPSVTKDRISSPLEAGSSLFDSKILPSVLTTALEYVSSRLARKNAHITLIVIRKEVQVPEIPDSPTLPTISRSSSRSSSISSSSTSSSMSLSRTRHPSLPSSPKDCSAVPRFNISASWAPALPCLTPTAPNIFGLSLIHSSSLTARDEKVLRATIVKAEKKFAIGGGWLPPKPLVLSAKCSATNDLICRSLVQNEILFSSKGLTLLSLDHVYTFKGLLHTYSRTLTASDLTLAVDELQRLVLVQQGQRTTKSHLLKTYDWLGVSLAALVDVNEGYKTAYGGPARKSGIEVQDPQPRPSLPNLSLQTSFSTKALPKKPFISPHPGFLVRLSTASTISTSSFCNLPSSSSTCCSEVSWFSDDDDTPLPLSTKLDLPTPALSCQFDLESLADRSKTGPRTPHGFEDITPVTKGEWCFLMVGNARTVPVVTC